MGEWRWRGRTPWWTSSQDWTWWSPSRSRRRRDWRSLLWSESVTLPPPPPPTPPTPRRPPPSWPRCSRSFLRWCSSILTSVSPCRGSLSCPCPPSCPPASNRTMKLNQSPCCHSPSTTSSSQCQDWPVPASCLALRQSRQAQRGDPPQHRRLPDGLCLGLQSRRSPPSTPRPGSPRTRTVPRGWWEGPTVNWSPPGSSAPGTARKAPVNILLTFSQWKVLWPSLQRTSCQEDQEEAGGLL